MLNRRSKVYLIAFFALTLNGSIVQADNLLITNANLIDGTGAAPVAGVSILVIDGRIARMGQDIAATEGMTLIDAAGKTVIPGLVDMHTHPSFEIRSENPKLPFPDPSSLPGSDADMREFVESRLPKRLELSLSNGVTTVISAGGYWPYDIEVRDRIAKGDLSGPRLLVSSPIFTAPGGHPASGICNLEPWCAKKLSVEVDNEADARKAVRRYADGGVEGIKFVYDSFDKTSLGGPDLNFPRLDEDVMAAIIEEAGLLGLPVIAHSKTVDETAVVARAGVDALVHAALMENTDFTTTDKTYLPQLVHEQKLTVTTTVRSFHERLEAAAPQSRARMQQNFDRVGPSLRAYQEAGVSLMFGTDFDGAGMDPDPGDAVRSEARALVAAGFSELEVISMATGNASQHPMVPDQLGSIQTGKIADLLVLAEDPLKDITAVTRPLVVLKAGKIVVDKR